MGESSLATALAISESCTAETAAWSAASLFVLAWAVLEKHTETILKLPRGKSIKRMETTLAKENVADDHIETYTLP